MTLLVKMYTIPFRFEFAFDLQPTHEGRVRLGNEREPKKLHTVSNLLNTATSFDLSIFHSVEFAVFAFLNKCEKRIGGKNPVLLCRFILNAHNK